jgi:hypothetical protein
VWERESLLIQQPQSIIRKQAGCVKVKEKFQYKTRYRDQALINYYRAEKGVSNDG